MESKKYKTSCLIWVLIMGLVFPEIVMGQRNENHDTNGNRPNIIFILTDDQRWDALGYAGNEHIKTPEMDKLARAGAYFRHAFSSTPICSASRASIFTGLYERTHKYTFQTTEILEEYMQKSYPALLNEAGYFTGFFGKFGINYNKKDQLFDRIEDYDRNNRYDDYRGYYYKQLDHDTVHLTRYTGARALAFIDSIPDNQPFCLSLSFSAPHAHDKAAEQYFWQEACDHLYRDVQMPGPDLAGPEWFNQLPDLVQNGFNRTRWHWRYDTPEKYQHSIKGYYRMIYGVDREIGKIRKKLKKRGMDQNTVIILMGDNGYFMGERQLAGKWLMYENSLRVPLVVYDPRLKTSTDIHDMALNIDIPSTIIDLAGIDQPPSWHGKSLMPIISGPTNSLQRDTILIEHLWEFESIPPSEGVRTDEWKYFRYVNNKSLEELYHLTSDPQETNNLADNEKYREQLSVLRQKTNQLSQKYSDPYSGVPTGLTIENIRDPEDKVAIVDEKPEFGWIVPDEAHFQKAYQILVATEKELIDYNIGDVWDTGTVKSNKSVDVEFEGTPLNPHTKYFWKVRIYDQDNRLSGYSKVQSFKTGSFEEEHLTSENYFQKEKIRPTGFRQDTDSAFFIDFGKAAFGTLLLNYSPKENDTLTIRLGEKLLNGNIDRKPGGSIRFQEVKQEVKPGKTRYRISLEADPRNTNEKAVALPDSFPVIMPFRYAEIEGVDNLKQNDVMQLAYFGYFDDSTSAFTSSDTILNQVWDLCKYSIKATTFAGVYVDGDRERIPYEADAYLNQMSHYSVDREFAMARKSIEYFMEHPTWPTEWQLHVALMFYQDYMHTGNSELVERYYEKLKHKTLMGLEVEDGFISTHSKNHNGVLMDKLGFRDTTMRLRDIVDWPPAQSDTGWELATEEGERDGFVFTKINTVVNSLYYKNMKIMATFARLLGKTDEALEFEYKASRVRKSINDQLFNDEAGHYVDGIGTDHGSVHANMMPLAFDIVPESRKKSVVEYIKTRGMACSVYGAWFLMEALYNAGASDYAQDLLTATHDRSWWNMIAVGSTITLEAWDMKYKPNADWNHAWGAVPANMIPRGLWGIKPLEPGFKEVVIKPQMGDLESSVVTTPTIRGLITCKYQQVSSRHQQYHIELPANMVGHFKTDWNIQNEITLNGKTRNPMHGSLFLEPGINRIDIR